MKILNKIAMAALFTGAIGTANAQYPGAECGCPDLGSRTAVSVASLVTNSAFTSNQVWTCDNIYTLDNSGPVYVEDGFTLTIEPGTVIRGAAGTGAAANSLVIARGGQIFANGTKECRIVFTSTSDVNVDGSYPVTNTSEWGSLLVLGRAQNNLRDGNSLLVNDANNIGDGIGVIEGLSATDPRNFYGVADGTLDGIVTSDFQNTESSGVIRYVSIRHGGTVIGADNEINGLTLGSVGSGTVLEHIEIVANEDDGIEFFGGTANLKYGSVLFCQDDYLDVDQAYTGNVQFFFGLQTDNNSSAGGTLGDHIIEADGEDSNGTQPAATFGNPQIFNVTGVNNGSDDCAELKANFEGTVANSIFVNASTGFNFVNSQKFLDEEILVYSNSFDDVSDLSIPNSVDALFNSNANITEAGVLPGYEFDPTQAVGPSNNAQVVPAVGTAGSVGPVPGGIDPVQYRGAFKPGVEPYICDGYLDSDLGGLGNIPNGCRSDLNGDGQIDTQDFGIFGADFVTGSCTGN